MTADILGFPHGERPGDTYDSGLLHHPCDVEPPPCEGNGTIDVLPKWTRESFLAHAHELVTNDRDKQYGDASVNLTNMEIMLDAFERICRQDYPLAAKAAIRMALVKIARTQTGIHQRDNYIDACGYMALAGESSERHG